MTYFAATVATINIILRTIFTKKQKKIEEAEENGSSRRRSDLTWVDIYNQKKHDN
jgi:hypothetical protein